LLRYNYVKNTQEEIMETKQTEQINKAEKLRNLRLFFGISQKEFGKKLGYTRETLNAYERKVNPVPPILIEKINKTMGIGREYFETDMTLQEAVEKYHIKPSDIDMLGDFGETNCFVYDGIENYAKNTSIEKNNLKLHFFELLFRLNYKSSYHFIRLNNTTNEPFASNGDILIVLKDTAAVNGDFVIVCFKRSYIIFQYFISGLDEVLLKGNNGIEIKLSGNDIDKVEILGIIKQKIVVSM